VVALLCHPKKFDECTSHKTDSGEILNAENGRLVIEDDTLECKTWVKASSYTNDAIAKRCISLGDHVDLT
jgi:hypothetical protein